MKVDHSTSVLRVNAQLPDSTSCVPGLIPELAWFLKHPACATSQGCTPKTFLILHRFWILNCSLQQREPKQSDKVCSSSVGELQ